MRALFGRAGRGIVALLRRDPSLRRNHFRVRRQKLRADIDCAVQQSAGIIAKIENERLHPLFLQIIERFAQARPPSAR